MTASIKERRRLCDREDVEDQEIKLENRRTIEPAQGAGEGNEPERLKKDENGIVFDRDTDGQEQRLARRVLRTAGSRRISAETAKLNGPRLNAGRRPGRTRLGSQNAL